MMKKFLLLWAVIGQKIQWFGSYLLATSKRCSLLTCLLLISFGVNGQTSERYDPAKVIPPSPTAASLGAYGNYEVGLYTGKPDINIPLYDIKTTDHSLSIKLQYDASAVRVSQQASWVGLNWSLSAGGVITRTVRGLDDFGGNGYYIAPALPTSPTLENKSYFDQISAGTMDSEPDIFCYNVGPYSGRFVIGKSADGGKVFVDNANNLRIEYLVSQWVITDGYGFKHYFGTQEITTHDYNYSQPIEIAENAPLSYYELSVKGAITSSWYLDSIVSPANDAIVFLYESDSKSLSLVQKSERESNLLFTSGYCSSMSPRYVAGLKTYSASRQVIQDLYLKKIVFQNGSIEFKRSDREDVEYIDQERPDKLSEVLVKDADNNLVKAFGFHQSYFNDGYMGRLKLDSLSEFDKYGNLKPPYRFSYFSNNLPNPYSKSIDHWGYYNRRPNNRFVPELYIPVDGAGIKHFAGADRSADTVAATLKQGVLSFIQYPTGGATEFDYELHEYIPKVDERFILKPQTRNAIANPDHQTSHAVDTFTLNELTHVTFNFNYEMAVEGATNFFNIENFYAYVLNADGSTYTAFSNYDCPGDQDPTCGSSAGTGSLVLPAGSYKIQVWYQQGWQTTMSASWKVKVPILKKTGGGIRVKSIINIDKGKQATIRTFSYTTDALTAGATTGRLISTPTYEYLFNADDFTWSSCTGYYATYVSRNSNTIFSMGLSSSGTIVGYDLVSEIFGPNGNGGKVEHTFMNSEAQESAYPHIPGYSSPYNGKLKQTLTSNAAGIQLAKVEFDYIIKEELPLRGIKLYQEFFEELTTTYLIQEYNDYSTWVVQSREKRTDNLDTQPIVNEKYLYYQNSSHRNVTRTEHLKSDGETIITKAKYPGDYTEAPSSSFPFQMRSRNIISPVIEEQTLSKVNGISRLIGGSFTKYDLFNGTTYQPSIAYKLRSSTSELDTTESHISSANVTNLHAKYEEEVFFDSYTAAGNLREFHLPNQGHQIYLWDYNSSLPVAHVINATESDVAYTSFESTSLGGFNFSGAVSVSVSTTAPTGKRVYSLTNATPISKTNLTSGTRYIVSYWTNSVPYSISGGSPVVPVKTVSSDFGWTYCEHLVQTDGTFLSISGTGSVDEVRIYPFQARMNTYTYDLLTGMTSSTDTNGITTHFEYDGFQRLKSVQDQGRNILKRYHYHYRPGSPFNP